MLTAGLTVGIAELVIGIVQLAVIVWLLRIARQLQDRAERLSSAARKVNLRLDAITELADEVRAAAGEFGGRHAAEAQPGRHAVSPPNDLESYAGSGFDLNGWHPGRGS